MNEIIFLVFISLDGGLIKWKTINFDHPTYRKQMIDEVANTHIGDSAKGVFLKGTQAFFAAQNAQEGHDDKKEEVNDDSQHGSNDHDDVLSF